MTIGQVIALVDAVKPNAFGPEAKVLWLNHLEGRLAADVFLLAPAEIRLLQYRWPEDQDTGLLVEEPHDDIYALYLQAKIDEANGEYLKYQATMDMYNQAFSSFLRWFAGLYDPVQGYIDEDHLGAHCAFWPHEWPGREAHGLCAAWDGAVHHGRKEKGHGAVQQSSALSDGLWIGREAGVSREPGRVAEKSERPKGRQG